MIYQTVSYKILAIVAVLLFIAVAPLPYGFYTFMRIIVCGCAGYMAYQGFSNEEKGMWPWILGFIAILFNPVATIHMTKEIWMAVDSITGIFFATLAYKSYFYQKGKGDE
jgi:hypothetical protein